MHSGRPGLCGTGLPSTRGSFGQDRWERVMMTVPHDEAFSYQLRAQGAGVQRGGGVGRCWELCGGRRPVDLAQCMGSGGASKSRNLPRSHPPKDRYRSLSCVQYSGSHNNPPKPTAAQTDELRKASSLIQWKGGRCACHGLQEHCEERGLEPWT